MSKRPMLGTLPVRVEPPPFHPDRRDIPGQLILWRDYPASLSEEGREQMERIRADVAARVEKVRAVINTMRGKVGSCSALESLPG